MNYNKKTVKDIDVAGKKVLLRCDFNVPQDKTTGAITDDKRIVAALPTIRYLLEQKAAVIACSHLGKPKGEWKESLSLAPVAKRLSELLGSEVIFAKDIIGEYLANHIIDNDPMLYSDFCEVCGDENLEDEFFDDDDSDECCDRNLCGGDCDHCPYRDDIPRYVYEDGLIRRIDVRRGSDD